MADIPTLGPAPDVALDDDAGKPRKRSWLVLAIVIVIVVVLAGAAAGAWFYLMRPVSKAKPAAAAPRPPVGPALYIGLDPPFVTNFEADENVRFLQLTVQVMTHDPATADLIKANDPVVRNDLLLLFSNQKYADIATSAGKEKLRSEALAAIRKVVAQNGGKPDNVEAVYFTSFVMQ